MLFPLWLFAQSPSKLIEKGEYDRAIEVCVDKLQNGKGKKDELYAELKHAQEMANADELKTIHELRASGQPDIWFDLFMAYSDLQKRYLTIMPVSDMLEADMVKIELTDYSSDVETSRQNAAAYSYAHGLSLLKTGEKADAGKAYDEFLLVSKLYADFKDIDVQMRRALGKSATLARLEVNNLSGASLPPDFIADIEDITLTYREKQYLDYVVRAKPGQQYSLILAIDINSVNVTPGTVNEKEYTTSHKNPESFAANYDDPEKFEQDKKHEDFNKCKVKEIYQIKTAVIKGKVKYIDKESKAIMYAIPVTARSVFENKTATASGDLYACPPEIVEILDTPKLKFPKNGEMVTKAGKEFKMLVKGIIWDPDFIK
ncbi:MAG: hypothetical protein V2I47_08805 [Bacteroidales bacterium]|nr:hypothetical protein [Bacteroidales bacterium]